MSPVLSHQKDHNKYNDSLYLIAHQIWFLLFTLFIQILFLLQSSGQFLPLSIILTMATISDDFLFWNPSMIFFLSFIWQIIMFIDMHCNFNCLFHVFLVYLSLWYRQSGLHLIYFSFWGKTIKEISLSPLKEKRQILI